jgi:hypothetical protein
MALKTKPPSFYDVITEAINDMIGHGFDKVGRVEYWTNRIRVAAEAVLTPQAKMEKMLREELSKVYAKLVDKGEIARFHPGVELYTIAKLKPKMRAELDRRIMASASLIKLNRKKSVDSTLARFVGWSTSIPAGGTTQASRQETKDALRKGMAQLPHEERRVLIDQGHKLTAAINEVVATGGGAIAVQWHSHWRQAGYDFREDHKERDDQVYVLRESWARDKGLVKAGPNGFYDTITAVAEEPFCRCYATFIYALARLPTDCLTAKGKSELDRVRAELAK